MRLFPRGLTTGVFLLILLTSACNLPAQSPTPVGTILPTGQTPATSAPTLPVSTETPMTLIPVTGSQDVLLQCQFCVNDEPHAVLILPESAAFLVSEPVVGVNCITAQVVNDRRILFCRGAQQTVFTLNVCFDGTSCLQYPITLETCPLSEALPALAPHRWCWYRRTRGSRPRHRPRPIRASPADHGGDHGGASFSNVYRAAPGDRNNRCPPSSSDTNSAACHPDHCPASG